MTSFASTLSAFYACNRTAQSTVLPGRLLIVIPTLNEARHIVSVIQGLLPGARRLGAGIVVVDGGSTDGTVDLVCAEAGRTPGVFLLNNPLRLQSAAVNLAISSCPHQVDWLIRVDAHSAYPADYCEILLDEARRTGADSVVVRMHATGHGFLQRNIAAAQNSIFGNGGSAHRGGDEGRFVDHGHHALMRVSAFRQVGGYDRTFSHNEDAELDARLRKAGYHIWLTGRTRIEYFPRDTFRRLVRQYFNFGRGRLATARKHTDSLRKRHFILISLAPFACLSALSVVHPIHSVPLALWFLICSFAGLLTAFEKRMPSLAFCGFPAAVMQLAWSFGFWSGLLQFASHQFQAHFDGRRKQRSTKGGER